MAEFDLTTRICAHLDHHLALVLVEFIDEKKIYDHKDLLTAQLKLSNQSNMVDTAMDIFKQLNPTEQVPQDMVERKQQVMTKMQTLKDSCKPLLELLEQEELLQQLRNDKQFTAPYLAEQFSITNDHIEALYHYAKFQFECGAYAQTSSYLHHYRLLSSNPDNSFNALWGKLAADILRENFDEAMECCNHLKEAIDQKTFPSPLVQLQQRTWLIHWSLFVFFKHPNGRTSMCDLFFQDKYMNAIQTSSPYILRYLAIAVITNKRRRNVLKRLVDVIQQERYTYKDPITELVEDLYVHFDFETAQKKLLECEKVLTNDYFLASLHDEFVETAKLFIFETYCRIHQCIDISMLASKLRMEPDAAERWIVNLIRGARLDAKIDSKTNQVVMNVQYPSVYDQVVEKTKGLQFRSLALASATRPSGSVQLPARDAADADASQASFGIA